MNLSIYHLIALIAIASSSFALINVQSTTSVKRVQRLLNMQNKHQLTDKIFKTILSSTVGLLILSPSNVLAETTNDIEKIPLLTKRTNDLQSYADISRGFRLLRYYLYL